MHQTNTELLTRVAQLTQKQYTFEQELNHSTQNVHVNGGVELAYVYCESREKKCSDLSSLNKKILLYEKYKRMD